MITRVRNTFNFGVNNNNFSRNKYVHPRYEKLSFDTVSFSGKASQELIEKTVDLAFNKLQKLSYPNLKFSGITKNKVNVNILETSYDSNLILTLTNLNCKDKTYALYEFNKQSNQPSKIISLGENYVVTDINTIKMINEILENTKQI